MAERAKGFIYNTRRKVIELPVLTKPTGGGSVSVNLPKTGILSKIYLQISATVAGVVAANPLGYSSIVRGVRLKLNSGNDIFNVSGAVYSYLLNEILESEYFLAQGQNQGRSAVINGTANLDMVIPVGINMRDPVGYIMLQNEQTLATLDIDFESDTTVGGAGCTVSATVTPIMEFFTVPADPADLPRLDTLHQIVYDSQPVSAAGQVIYNVNRGGNYLAIAHGLGIGVAGADGFDRVQTRVNQSDYIQDTGVGFLDMEHRLLRGRARPAGTIFIDYLATSGNGNYGSARDLLNSAYTTQYEHVINATGVGTLYTLRRQLLPIR